MGECRYGSSHSQPRQEMRMGGELYAPDVLLTVGLRAGLNLWRTENILPATYNETTISRTYYSKPSHFIEYAKSYLPRNVVLS